MRFKFCIMTDCGQEMPPKWAWPGDVAQFPNSATLHILQTVKVTLFKFGIQVERRQLLPTELAWGGGILWRPPAQLVWSSDANFP